MCCHLRKDLLIIKHQFWFINSRIKCYERDFNRNPVYDLWLHLLSSFVSRYCVHPVLRIHVCTLKFIINAITNDYIKVFQMQIILYFTKGRTTLLNKKIFKNANCPAELEINLKPEMCRQNSSCAWELIFSEYWYMF